MTSAPDRSGADAAQRRVRRGDAEPGSGSLGARLGELTLSDERRLRRRLDQARRASPAERRTSQRSKVERDIAVAEARIARRRAAVPSNIDYPEQLPVSQARDELAAAIRDHQVVVVAGETGSGKTTQLPKICLELGRGVRGLIGHTQPRRIAARTVAERIAEELDVPLGTTVGYTVRFTDQVRDDTLVKLMTDGILLTELQRDRLLLRYDTLIIDEAHERSLNVDFILGYLKQLLPRRPDLKVIITSATIDPERFSRHFDDAPIVEVSGRTYPVEVRYRPLVDVAETEDDDGAPEVVVRDQIEAICEAVEELYTEGGGDILVFLSGEREIRDTADALSRVGLPGTEVVPLYARLSAAEQHRVFERHTGRRVVLATNVAETSLTVPGITYVVDPGTARISRYSNRTKVQRLPIEPISQASANQRKGRCGRTSDGVCIRLYSQEDFEARPEFTDPEILRTNLASVILQMTAIGLGDIAGFPFVDPPDRRNINDGIQLLEELGALDPRVSDPHKRLTDLGRTLAQIPVDPRLGRMVVEADRNGCLEEVLVIAAALSIQDPRERPTDKQQAADEKHARFADKTSDFLAYLNLWRYLGQQQDALSSSRFRRLCKTEFLNYLRVREWQDLAGQLRSICRSLGMAAGGVQDEPDDARIHQSLLAGLLSHVGLRDAEKGHYVGARNARFAIFPGSALFKKQPDYVMAAELVETSRLWGRIVARIDPAWAERLGAHLVKRTYSEPHWDRRRGAVMAYEKVTLYGVPLVASRRISYGSVDPDLARDLFIRHALVEGEWDTHHAFWRHNQELLAEVSELEERVRRRDIAVDDEPIFDFYDARVPAEVVSARHFDSWWKKARRQTPDLLDFDRSLLVNEHAAGGVDERAFPDVWSTESAALPASYRFEPGATEDGVTLDVPVAVLNRLRPEEFEWQIPGLREELLTALIRGLPKAIRRNFVPAPDFARAVLARVRPGQERLYDALERELRAMTGVVVPREAWSPSKLPPHLRIAFRVLDAGGKVLGTGEDLEVLQRELAPRMRAAVAKAAPSLERRGLRAWDFDRLPRAFERRDATGHVVRGFPALADEGEAVGIRIFQTPAEQAAAMVAGTRRLLLLNVPSPVRAVQARLPNTAKLALMRNPYGGVVPLLDDCVACAVDAIVVAAGGPAWGPEEFEALRDRVAAELDDAVLEVLQEVRRILDAAHAVESAITGLNALPFVAARTDLQGQLAALVYPGFISATGRSRLPDVTRYLHAMLRRIERLPADAARDRERQRRIEAVQQAYDEAVARLPERRRGDARLVEVRWLVEELRVSVFAQSLGTRQPVSEARIYRALDEVV